MKGLLAVSRFWFRLAEVLPIAEHALACPQHRITAAQSLAGPPLRPALVWTRPWGQETLTSSGVPVWCGRYHDVVHGAPAHTWWHEATNRRGTGEQPLPEHRFLGLQEHHRDGRPPLITLLREGARRRAHWLVINTEPALVDRPERFELPTGATTTTPSCAGSRTTGATPTRTAATSSAPTNSAGPAPNRHSSTRQPPMSRPGVAPA